jgi:hypothetical protein
MSILTNPCSLTSGNPLPCNNAMPGILKCFIADWNNVTGATINASNVITAITMNSATYFYEFDLEKEGGEIVENIISTPTMGTTAYEQVFNMYLAHYQTSVRNQVMILAADRTILIALDRNGQYWLLGYTNGMNMAGTNTANTGKSYTGGDPNGYTLSFTAQEPALAYEVSSSIIPAIIHA